MDKLNSQGSAAANRIQVEDPFFIVGSERSGTTLLRLMLSHHPEIECAPEFEFLVEQMTPEEVFPSLPDYHAWLRTNRIFLLHRLKVDDGLSYPDLVKSFLNQYCDRSDKPIRGAICHKRFDRLLRFWPKARFVHLLRDGRDVARSCITMGWCGNVWHGSQRWLEAEALWDHLKTCTLGKYIYELRYEDLVRDPDGQLGELCEFLGTSYSPRMMDYAQGSTYSPPDPSLAEQWRGKLSLRDLGLLECRMGDRLRERGYPDSGVEPAHVGLLRRGLLGLQNRCFCFQFRCHRYGICCLLASKIAYALGLGSLQRFLKLKQGDIDNRYIK